MLAALVEDVRAHPVWATVEYGSLALAAALPVATAAAFATGLPVGADPVWLAPVAGGAALALVWTVVVPLASS